MNKDEVFLLDAGFNPSNQGFRCILAAVELARVNPEFVHRRIGKELYPEIAKKFGTTAAGVERSIRHAIEKAMDRLSPKKMDELEAKYGAGISTVLFDPYKGKPTNSKLIAWMAMALPGMGKERMT